MPNPQFSHYKTYELIEYPTIAISFNYDNQQLSLLPTQPNRDNLMAVIDKINQRMGEKTIYFAQEYSKKSLVSKRAYKSSSYTTNWHELAKATA